MTTPAPTHDSIRARFERIVHPGYSYCFRCGRPWASARPHDTDYGPLDTESWVASPPDGDMFPVGFMTGCFCLCKDCWEPLTIEEREPYYWTLIRWWDTEHPVGEDRIHDIIAAVRAGR